MARQFVTLQIVTALSVLTLMGAGTRANDLSPDNSITPAADVAAAPQWNMWGAALGGGGTTQGDADAGTSDVNSYGYGLATGWGKFVSPTEMRGFYIAAGGLGWDVADDLGDGKGVFLQGSVNTTKFLSSGYVSASGTYGFTNMKSNSVVEDETISAEFNTHTLTSRLEAGHALSPTLTPYAALQLKLIYTPAYDQDTTGDTEGLALGFDDSKQTSARTELGLKMQTKASNGLSLTGSLAWAHDFTGDESVQAHFVAIESDSFTITGAKPASDSALVSLGTTFAPSANTTLSFNVNGQFNEDSQNYGGGVSLAVTW